MQHKPQVASAKLITMYIKKNSPKPESLPSRDCLDYTEYKEIIP